MTAGGYDGCRDASRASSSPAPPASSVAGSCPALIDAGHEVRAMTRRPEEYDGPGTPWAPTSTTPTPCRPRSRASTSPTTSCTRWTAPTSRSRTPRAARAFGHGGRRGRGAPDRLPRRPRRRGRRSSPPTCARAARSRACSATAGVPVTVLRAAIVVGQGGISWELTRQLVKNLPAMVVPRWVSTRTQPIAVDDVIRYLVGVADRARGARPGLRDRRSRPAQLPRDARGRRRGLERPAGADHHGAGADAAAVVVLAGARHRRRRHHRPQPDRLDGHRGARHRPLHPRPRARASPLAYDEAVPPRRSRSRAPTARDPLQSAEEGRQHEEHRDRPDDVGDDRGEDAAGRATLEADERRRAARRRRPASRCRWRG